MSMRILNEHEAEDQVDHKKSCPYTRQMMVSCPSARKRHVKLITIFVETQLHDGCSCEQPLKD